MNLPTRRLLRVLGHPLIKNQPVARHLWPHLQKPDALLANKKNGNAGRHFTPAETEAATRYLRGELTQLLHHLTPEDDDQRGPDQHSGADPARPDEPDHREPGPGPAAVR